MIEGHRVDLVIVDEAHRLPEEERLAKDFMVLEGMPPALRLADLPGQQQEHGQEYQRRLQKIITEALLDDAFNGTIVRYAWADQHPKDWSPEQLRDAARDSVIRYARHHGLTFKFTHDQWGERWTWNEDQHQWYPSGVHGYSSEAVITGRVTK